MIPIQSIIPLELEIRIAIPTEEAAFHLMRTTQTLRAWASSNKAPIRPIRVNGRLAWPVNDIQKLLSGGKK